MWAFKSSFMHLKMAKNKKGMSLLQKEKYQQNKSLLLEMRETIFLNKFDGEHFRALRNTPDL